MASPSATAPLSPSLEFGPKLLSLQPRALFRAARHFPASFWALFAYVFFEYVRPQSAYPSIDVLPFARLALLSSVSLAVIQGGGVRRLALIDYLMFSYTAVVLLSLTTALDLASGLENLGLWFDWLMVYWAIATTVNTHARFLVLMSSWLLWNLKMSSFAVRFWASIGFSFEDWGVSGGPGWFRNSGEFGIEMCVFFPLSLYFALGVWRFVSKRVFIALLALPASAAIGAVASSSRGALLGIAAVALWMLARSKYKLRAFLSVVPFLIIFFAVIPPEQMERLNASGADETSLSRLTYWRHGIEMANEHPIFGVGYAGWIVYYRSHYSGRNQLSHNIFIQCLSELGYVGLAALLALIVGSFVVNQRTRRAARILGPPGEFAYHMAWGLDGALIGFMVSGFFVTVLYYPYLWVNLGFTAALHLTVSRVARELQRRQAPRLTGSRVHGTQ